MNEYFSLLTKEINRTMPAMGRKPVFEYIAEKLQITTKAIYEHFGPMGWPHTEISKALTALQADGSIALDDNGILTIGSPSEFSDANL